MNVTTEDTKKTDRRRDGLLVGAIASAFFALVFGICLWTILDAIHPAPRAAAPVKVATME
jgi:hypothetical protein